MSELDIVGNSHLLGCATTPGPCFVPHLRLSSLNPTRRRPSSASDRLSILQRAPEEGLTWVQLPLPHCQGGGGREDMRGLVFPEDAIYFIWPISVCFDSTRGFEGNSLPLCFLSFPVFARTLKPC